MTAPQSFTGRSRRRSTHWTVKVSDRAARLLIAIGGIGTIAAVMLVSLYLLSVVAPLFRGAEVGQPTELAELWSQSPMQIGMDEYRDLGWALMADGTIHAFALDGQSAAREVGQSNPFESDEEDAPVLTAWNVSATGSAAVFGFSDGSVRLGRIGYQTSFVEEAEVPAALRELPIGGKGELDEGVATRISATQFRVQQLDVSLDDPTPAVEESPVLLVDHASRSDGDIYCSLSANGTVAVNSVRERENLLTGETTVTVRSAELPLPTSIDEPAAFLRITGLGDMVYVAWTDGRLLRFDIRNLDEPRQVEEVDLVTADAGKLTALEFLLGRTTLLAGDSLGNVRAWFPVRAEEGDSVDGWTLVPGRELPAHTSAVSSLAPSPRSRMAAAGYDDGTVQMLYITSESSLAVLSTGKTSAVAALTVAPKSDAVLAADAGGATWWEFEAGHPEVSVSTLLRPVWYEGYAEPAAAWQTSGGQDAFEPKYGLWPLIFGTLKATFYSMIFGAPLALLAAIYTSEFLRPRTKARIKPCIEMMASLPSVVLGFLAGLVIAPLVEDRVAQVVSTVYIVPVTFLLAAYLWQLVPHQTAIRLARWKFGLLLVVALPAGLMAGQAIAPFVERWLFAGNMRDWLNRQVGTATGGWMLLFIPLSAVGTALFMARVVNPWVRGQSRQWTRFGSALVELLKFFVGIALTLVVALAISALLTSWRLDPRDYYLGTYVQRNAMIVGFVMGFAIIPIIYTLADDALSSVPSHLRSASLGAGASPWQTATRIVIPTAMSGLFSAVMIGLGRAVGETMIVLMAAGNTPITEWNVFNGFQTLSAAIATELPEAPPGETHFRVLFLAALALFVMTFAVNTVAELVRLRFRRRAYEL